MQLAICLLSVMPVRLEPSHRSEMVSQLLFGEYALVGEEKADFVAVKCTYDGYEGWVQASQLTFLSDQQIKDTDTYTITFSTEVNVDGHGYRVPFACPVYGSPQLAEALTFGNRSVRFANRDTPNWRITDNPFSEKTLQKAIAVYLHAPYLWGGKSVWGTDCSGFAQQVFKLFSVKLLRDAYLQAAQGVAVKHLHEAAYGDLLFFQNEKGRIMHVGILLQNNQIVHASGSVRIDVVNENGIIHSETGKQTHHLHSIRRFF